MAQTSIEIRSLAESSLAVGSSGAGTVTITIDRAKDAGGMDLGFNGGELLLLAPRNSREVLASTRFTPLRPMWLNQTRG